MPRRTDSFGYGVSIPTTSARATEAAIEIWGDDPDDLAFVHSAFASTFLPYRNPPDGARDYHRTNGRASLVVSAGHLMTPDGEMVLQGIPYGAKPRLLMTHMCTEAVRLRSPVVPIGDSMSAFMRSLGFKVTGGKHGTIGRFKDQLNRLAASRLQLGFNFGDHTTTVNTQLVDRFDVWFPRDPGQRVLWPSEIVLSDKFYGHLKDHALPLDPRALKALQHNARALDIYTWLAHRLPRVKKRGGDRVSWAALHGQFGGEMHDRSRFRRDFKKALFLAMTVYRDARVEQVDGGVLLKASRAAVKVRTAPAVLGGSGRAKKGL